MTKNLIPSCNKFCNRNKISTITDKNGCKTSYIAINTDLNELDCYRIDGCLNSINEKCDFLLLNIDKANAYFIELKGSDLLKAISQIDSSLDMLQTKLNGYNINARVVLTKVHSPDLMSSKYLHLRNRIKRLNGSLLQNTNRLVERL